MTENNTDTAKEPGAKSAWRLGFGKAAKTAGFFHPDDFDIFVNKITGDAYIFHGPPLPQPVERLEFNAANNRVTVFTKSGKEIDLGVKVQWLVRPFFKRAKTVYIVQTKDGKTLDGIEVPMSVKGE